VVGVGGGRRKRRRRRRGRRREKAAGCCWVLGCPPLLSRLPAMPGLAVCRRPVSPSGPPPPPPLPPPPPHADTDADGFQRLNDGED